MGDSAIVIPARFASSRYPGKPLAVLRGAYGTQRSLLERSVMAARAAAEDAKIDAIYVATDDDRIAAEAERIGAEVIMTSPERENGTARVAEAVVAKALPQDMIVNLQGDAPLTPPHFVTALVDAMRAQPERQVATPVLRCDREALAGFRADRQAGRVGGTTVVRNRLGEALYFSKEVIPYTSDLTPDAEIPVFHHVGLYAYRQEALRRYTQLPVGTLETLEGLEQLRFLENGYPIAAIEVDSAGHKFWEINNPSDVPRVEAMLRAMSID